MNSLSCKCMPANLPTFIFVHFCCVIRRINSNQMVSLNILNILWNQQFIFVTSRDHTSQVNSAVLLDFIHFSSIHELRNTLTSVMLYHQTLSSILNECAFQIFFCYESHRTFINFGLVKLPQCENQILLSDKV